MFLRNSHENIGLTAVPAAAMLLVGLASAVHADPGSACCIDLETRVAELEALTARKGNRNVDLKVWGFVNEAAMYWNDGFADNVYLITNEVERSRVGYFAEAKIARKWSTGALLEVGIRGNREGRLDQETSIHRSLPDVRYSYWWLKNDDLGKLSVGLTAMASYHIVDMMTASTWYFARQGIGAWIGSEGNGFFLRKEDGTLTNGANALRWGDIDAHAPDASPGNGRRLDAVRFETPDLFGFVVSTAFSGEGAADVALRYKKEVGDFELVAGIGYAQYSQHEIRRCAVVGDPDAVRCHTLGLSGSVSHVPSGLYVYGAYGQQRDLKRRALFQGPVENVDRNAYVQVGLARKLFAAGKTTIFAEYERDNVGAGVNATTGGILDATALGPSPLPAGDTAYDRIAATEINTYGLGLNQSIEAAALNLYVSGRLFSADVYTSASGLRAGAVETPIEDFLMIIGGARIEF